MKSLEPGCLALIISGAHAGKVVTVICHLPAGSGGVVTANHKGIFFTAEYRCKDNLNWLIEGVNGVFCEGQEVERCEITFGDAKGTAVCSRMLLMRIDGFNPEEFSKERKDNLQLSN